MAPFNPPPPNVPSSSLPSIHTPGLPHAPHAPYPDIPLSSLRGYTPPDQALQPSQQPPPGHAYSFANRVLPRHPFLHSRPPAPKPLNSPLVTTNTPRYHQPPPQPYHQHHYHFQDTQPPQPQLQRAIDLDVFGSVTPCEPLPPSDILSSHPTTVTPFSHPTSRSIPSYASASLDYPFPPQQSPHSLQPSYQPHPIPPPASDLVSTPIDYDPPNRQETNFSDLTNLPSLNLLPSSQQPLYSSAADAAAAAAAMSLSNSNLLAPFQSQHPSTVDLTSATRVPDNRLPDISAPAVSQVPDLVDPHAPEITGIVASSRHTVFESIPSATPAAGHDVAIHSIHPPEPVRNIEMATAPSQSESFRPRMPEYACVNRKLTPLESIPEHVVATPVVAALGPAGMETSGDMAQRNVSSRSSTNVIEDGAPGRGGPVSAITMANGSWQTQTQTLARRENSDTLKAQGTAMHRHEVLNNDTAKQGAVVAAGEKGGAQVETGEETGSSRQGKAREGGSLNAGMAEREDATTRGEEGKEKSVEAEKNSTTATGVGGMEKGSAPRSRRDQDSEVAGQGSASRGVAEGEPHAGQIPGKSDVSSGLRDANRVERKEQSQLAAGSPQGLNANGVRKEVADTKQGVMAVGCKGDLGSVHGGEAEGVDDGDEGREGVTPRETPGGDRGDEVGERVGVKRKRGGVETRMTSKRRRNAELSLRAEVGDEVSVYWEDDRQFYDGVIQEKSADGKYRIVYLDGDVEILDLSDPKETWRFTRKGRE